MEAQWEFLSAWARNELAKVGACAGSFPDEGQTLEAQLLGSWNWESIRPSRNEEVGRDSKLKGS